MSRWAELPERLYLEDRLNNKCWVPDRIHFPRSGGLYPAKIDHRTPASSNRRSRRRAWGHLGELVFSDFSRRGEGHFRNEQNLRRPFVRSEVPCRHGPPIRQR